MKINVFTTTTLLTLKPSATLRAAIFGLENLSSLLFVFRIKKKGNDSPKTAFGVIFASFSNGKLVLFSIFLRNTPRNRDDKGGGGGSWSKIYNLQFSHPPSLLITYLEDLFIF